MGAAAVVTKTIKLGTGVCLVVQRDPIHTAKEVATVDRLSGGRLLFGIGGGWNAEEMADHGTAFATRFKLVRERIEAMKEIWTKSKPKYTGEFVEFDEMMQWPKPVQKPHPPIWLGGGHPDALRRAAAIADGWMGAGGSSTADFARCVPALRENLERARRNPATFPVSKRVFLSVHERPDVARAEVHRWFTTVYHNPAGTDASGVHGTAEQVRERLEELVRTGANHLLLNPVCRHAEQLEALAAIVGHD
jgi:probable F420-dependent oxidoreductase